MYPTKYEIRKPSNLFLVREFCHRSSPTFRYRVVKEEEEEERLDVETDGISAGETPSLLDEQGEGEQVRTRRCRSATRTN